MSDPGAGPSSPAAHVVPGSVAAVLADVAGELARLTRRESVPLPRYARDGALSVVVGGDRCGDRCGDR